MGTLRAEERLDSVEYQLKEIKWDVIGTMEMRIKGEGLVRRKSGNILYLKGNGENAINGVGFIINRRLEDQLEEVTGTYERLAYVKIRINAGYSIQILQAYFPTTEHPDEEVEKLYESIEKILREVKTHYSIVMRVFNAKVGKRDNILNSGRF